MTKEEIEKTHQLKYIHMSDFSFELNCLWNEVFKYDSIFNLSTEDLIKDWRNTTTELGKLFMKRKNTIVSYGIELGEDSEAEYLAIFKKAKEDFNKPLPICPECKSEYTSYLADSVNICDSCNNSFNITT